MSRADERILEHLADTEPNTPKEGDTSLTIH